MRSVRLGWFFRNADTGRVVVAQVPNLPLWLWIGATAVQGVFRPHGPLATVLSVAGTVGLAVWAALELARGDSPFRRVLGGLVLAWMILGVVRR